MDTNTFNHPHQEISWLGWLLLQLSRSAQLFLSFVRVLSPISDQTESEWQLRTLVKDYSDQGNYVEAIAILTQLIERYSQSAIDYNNRGLMYFCNNQFQDALNDYNYAIALNPKLDKAYNNRANCYSAQGNWAAALADYEIALDLNPGNLKAWINQGITFRELGLYDLALENFDLALILGRKLQGHIYAERGHTYHLRGDWNCAIADYYRALDQLSSKNTINHYKQRVEMWLNQLLNPLSA